MNYLDVISQHFTTVVLAVIHKHQCFNSTFCPKVCSILNAPFGFNCA